MPLKKRKKRIMKYWRMKLDANKFTYWKLFEAKVCYMRGNISQAHPKFGISAKNRQGSAIVMVALAYASLTNPKVWRPRDLDKIVDIGNDLYRTTCVALKYRIGTLFPPSCVHPIFYVESIKFTTFVERCEQIHVNYEDLEQTDLLSIFIDIRNFFNTQISDGLILVFGCTFFAFWRKNGIYYLYCPHSLDPSGCLTDPSVGSALVLKAKKVQQFSKFLDGRFYGLHSIYTFKIVNKEEIEKDPEKVLENFKSLQYKYDIDKCFRPFTPKEKIDEATGGVPSGSGIASAYQQSVAGAESINPAASTSATAAGDAGSRTEGQDPDEKMKPQALVQDQDLTFSADYEIISSRRGVLCAKEYERIPSKIFHDLIAAAIYLYHFRSYLWTSQTMKDIFELAEQMYEISKERELITKDTCVDTDWANKIVFPVEFAKQMYYVDYENIVYGDLSGLDPNISDLPRALKDFFERCDVGLVIGPQNVLIWQERGYFFLFDVKERDSRGRKWTKGLATKLGSDAEEGTACVTWYKSVETLATIYFNNIAPKHRRDTFRILNIKVMPEKKCVPAWYAWIGENDKKRVIAGNMSIVDVLGQKDANFNAKLLAISTVASIYGFIRHERAWDPRIIDNIMLNGMRIYKDSSMSISDTSEMDISLSSIKKTNIIDGFRVTFIFLRGELSGTIFGNPKNLEDGMEEFFRSFYRGILQAEGFVLAIWTNGKEVYAYFLFENRFAKSASCFCDVEKPKTGVGAAVAMQFKTIKDLHDDIIPYLVNGKYTLTPIDIKLAALAAKDDFKSYTQISKDSAILRVAEHEGSETFGFRGYKQSVTNVLTAIGYTYLHKAEDWTEMDLRDILRNGDKIYCRVLQKQTDPALMQEKLLWTDAHILIGTNTFTFSRSTIDGLIVNPIHEDYDDGVEIEEADEGGEQNVFALAEGVIAEGELEEQFTFKPDLREVLVAWEDLDHVEAILECAFFTVAIWKRTEANTTYYIFDSRERDDMGLLGLRSLRNAMAQLAKFRREGPYPELKYPDPKLEDALINYPTFGGIDLRRIEEKVLEQESGAYVAQFKSFESFSEHVISKVPEKYRHEPFFLHTLTTSTQIGTSVVRKAGFESYRICLDGLILRATTSQEDPMFLNRGKQEIGNALVALAIGAISTSEKWSPGILDMILKYGDRLYGKSLINLKKTDLLKACITDKLDITKIITEFSIYNIKFSLKVVGTPVVSMLAFGENGDLRNSVVKLKSIDSGMGSVLNYKGYTIAIWKSKGAAYLFDPYENDPNGLFLKNGFCYVMAFDRVANLVNFVDKKFSCISSSNMFKFSIINISYAFPPPLSKIPGMNLNKLKLVSRLGPDQTAFAQTADNIKTLSGFIEPHKMPKSVVCLAIILYSKIHFVELWNTDVFENILMVARFLYGSPKCDKTVEDYAFERLHEVDANFELKNNYFHLDIANVIQGPVQSSDIVCGIDLKEAIVMHFRISSNAIICVNNRYIAIFKDLGTFYVFYDTSGDDKYAYVVSSSSLRAILGHIDNIIPKNSNWYELKNVRIVIIPLNDECWEKRKQAIGEAARSEDPERELKYPHYDAIYTRKKGTHEFIKETPDEDVEIVLGSYNMVNHRFRETDKFVPCMLATLLIAAGMTKIVSLHKWKPKLLDGFIEAGINLYKNSVVVTRKDCLKITEMERRIFLSDRVLNVIPYSPIDEFICNVNVEQNYSALKCLLQEHKILYAHDTNICFLLVWDLGCFFIFLPSGVLGATKSEVKECVSPILLKFQTVQTMLKQITEYACGSHLKLGPIQVYAN